MAIAIHRSADLHRFFGRLPESRWVAAPRECRGQPGIGLDCGRGANSWPCLSPQLLPLLTKIKANRDKSRFIEHGRRRQGARAGSGEPARDAAAGPPRGVLSQDHRSASWSRLL